MGSFRIKLTVFEGEQKDTEPDIIDSKSSESSNQNLKFFKIFSKRNGENNLSSKAKVSIRSKGKTRTPGRIIKSNPTHPLITSHFKPASKESKASNEPGDENGGGQENGISSDNLLILS